MDGDNDESDGELVLFDFHHMLSRLKQRIRGGKEEVKLTRVNYTKEHVSLAKAIARRRRFIRLFWDHLTLIRQVSPSSS